MDHSKVTDSVPKSMHERAEASTYGYDLVMRELPDEEVLNLRSRLGLPVLGYPAFSKEHTRAILCAIPHEFACALVYMFAYGKKDLEAPQWVGIDSSAFRETVENLAGMIRERASSPELLLNLNADELKELFVSFLHQEEKKWDSIEA